MLGNGRLSGLCSWFDSPGLVKRGVSFEAFSCGPFLMEHGGALGSGCVKISNNRQFLAPVI